MQNLFTSIVRTLVPYLVGFVVSVFTAQGLEVSQDLQVQLASFMTFAFGGLYYVLVRLMARKFPQLEWLLGVPVKPVYKEIK
jgi:hypothetical protein